MAFVYQKKGSREKAKLKSEKRMVVTHLHTVEHWPSRSVEKARQVKGLVVASTEWVDPWNTEAVLNIVIVVYSLAFSGTPLILQKLAQCL
jgi:hypothetical protein